MTTTYVIPFTIPAGQRIAGASDAETTFQTALAVWERILEAKPAGAVTVYAPRAGGVLMPVGSPPFPVPFPIPATHELNVLARQFFAVHADPGDDAMIRNAARLLGCR